MPVYALASAALWAPRARSAAPRGRLQPDSGASTVNLVQLQAGAGWRGWRCPRQRHHLHPLQASSEKPGSPAEGDDDQVEGSGPSGSGRGGSSSSSMASSDKAATAEQQQQRKRGRPRSVAPAYDPAQLLVSLGLPSLGAGAVQQAMVKLRYILRQQGVLQHGPAVAAHLRGLGVGEAQLGRLLQRCPELFSWPVEQRAGLLFVQLQQLGLTAAQAAKCFEQQPVTAETTTFQPAVEVLAALFEAAGSEGGKTGQQQLGQLLRGQPAASQLLYTDTCVLQERINHLRQLGLSSRQLVAALRLDYVLLARRPDHLAALQSVLQQVLGAGLELLVKSISQTTRLSAAMLRRGASALVNAFGQDTALDMAGRSPWLLNTRTTVWQTALEVARLHGVADPAALMRDNPQPFTYKWLEPARLVNRLAVQRCMGLSPAAVYQRHAGYLLKSAERLAGRLLYLEQLGLQRLLVENKREWRQEGDLLPNKSAAGEPEFVSLANVAALVDEEFCSLPAVKGSGGSLEGLKAFQAGLSASPVWQQLCTEAAAEAARLRAQLPAELQQAAESNQPGRWRQQRSTPDAFL